MMYNEFVERVGMEVSSSEFEIINNMYMFADVDKDTFCKNQDCKGTKSKGGKGCKGYRVHYKDT